MSLEKNLERIAIALEGVEKLLSEIAGAPLVAETVDASIESDAVEAEVVVAPAEPKEPKKAKKKTAKKTVKKDTPVEEEKPKYDEDALRKLGKAIHQKHPKGVGMSKVHDILKENGAPNHKIFELPAEAYDAVGQQMEEYLAG